MRQGEEVKEGLEPKFINLVTGRRAKENIRSGEAITFSKVM